MSYLDQARSLDSQDPLAENRQEFQLPEGKIYLDGNSLGALPAATMKHVEEVITKQWGEDLITSWNAHAWIDLPEKVGEKIAPLLGAAPGQVICCDSISVNLHKLLCCALHLRPGRQKIVAPEDSFPTDLYMVQGLAQLLGSQAVTLVTVPEKDLVGAIDEQVAAVLFSHVNYKTGYLLPAEELVSSAHSAGALAIIDVAHSAGVIPLQLDEWGTDFAVGCGYKFLNGGPGAPAFLYAASRLHEASQQPLTGWMGHERPFEFDPAYAPSAGIKRFLTGTPPILSMAALDAALDLFERVDVHQLRSKSQALGDFYIELIKAGPIAPMLELVSPDDSSCRGSQVALRHPHSYAICQALIDGDVVMDHRDPDVLRAGFSPVYNSFEDVAAAVEVLEDVLLTRRYLDEVFSKRYEVT